MAGMTMTQKILARKAGLEKVQAGQIIDCPIDLALANDITGAPAIREFRKIGVPVFDPAKIALIPDHFTPNKDIASAQQAKEMRDFVKEAGIVHYYEVGRMGIEHVLLPEAGLVAPGEVIIGADSHTCTYGAVGAFSTGVGSTDLGASMAAGSTWFKVPAAIRVELVGALPPWVGGKDVILTVIGQLGVEGARYESLEFTGPGVASLSMSDRLTVANMAIEAGAKNGIFPVDEVTREYLAGRVSRNYEEVEADADAVYERTLRIDLSQLEPVVAKPHLPENVAPARELAQVEIDQVIIGSCTNGRLEDLAQAAAVLKGRQVHPHVRAIIIPGSQEVYRQAIGCGYIDAFIAAGEAVSTPTCGPCLGGHMGILAAGEKAVATTNRNFRGRMGHVDSEVYLAGPGVAAASAVLGRIGTPEEVCK